MIHLAALSVRLRLSQSNPLTPASGAPTALHLKDTERSNGLITIINHVKPSSPSFDDDSPK